MRRSGRLTYLCSQVFLTRLARARHQLPKIEIRRMRSKIGCTTGSQQPEKRVKSRNSNNLEPQATQLLIFAGSVTQRLEYHTAQARERFKEESKHRCVGPDG